MNSYQKLKQRNEVLSKKIDRLLSDPEFLMTEILTNRVRLGIDRALLFGSPFLIHKPKGKVKFNGLFNKMIKP